MCRELQILANGLFKIWFLLSERPKNKTCLNYFHLWLIGLIPN